eukprot:COSAG06_NODE_5220_length_3629_cov_17.340129_5_plen_125_part_00
MMPPPALKRVPWHWLATVALAAAFHHHERGAMHRDIDGARLDKSVTEAKVEAMGQRLLDISAAHDDKVTALQTQVDKLEQLVRGDEERRRTQRTGDGVEARVSHIIIRGAGRRGAAVLPCLGER